MWEPQFLTCYFGCFNLRPHCRFKVTYLSKQSAGIQSLPRDHFHLLLHKPEFSQFHLSSGSFSKRKTVNSRQINMKAERSEANAINTQTARLQEVCSLILLLCSASTFRNHWSQTMSIRSRGEGTRRPLQSLHVDTVWMNHYESAEPESINTMWPIVSLACSGSMDVF